MQQLGQAVLDLIPSLLQIASNKDVGKVITAIGDGIDNLVKSFANWVTDGGFQDFMNWIAKNGPDIVGDIGDVAKGAGKLLVALAPLGKVLDDIVGAAADLIGALSPLIEVLTKVYFIGNALAVDVLKAVADGFDYLDTHAGQFFADLKQWAGVAWQAVDQDFIQPLITFFETTIPNDLADVVSFFKALPGNIVTALGNFWTRSSVA
jgi:hypothetical protein